MRRCKRKILLIFGYVLIAWILFIPSQEIYFSFQVKNISEIKKIRIEHKNLTVFFPFIIKNSITYDKYKKWEELIRSRITEQNYTFTDALRENLELTLKEEIKKLEEEAEIGNRLIETSKGFVRIIDIVETLKPGEKNAEYYLTLNNMKEILEYKTKFEDLFNDLFASDVRENLERLIKDTQKEFSEKFGEKPYYYKLRIEFFITELVIIIFTAGFAYIIFCVVLRKEKREKE